MSHVSSILDHSVPKSTQMVTWSTDLVFAVDGETHGYNKLEPFVSSKVSIPGICHGIS